MATTDTTINVRVNTTDAERALGRLNSAITALGAAFAGNAITDFIDSTTNLKNKLSQVTNSTEELAMATDELFQISSNTGASIDATARLYQKLSMSTESLGLTQEGVMKMTDLVSKSFATAGMTTAELSSATTQLGQAFTKGYINGDEFNTIAENSPKILNALAATMGVSTSELKKLGSEGKITGIILRDAFLKNAEKIEQDFAKMSRTLGMELNYIKNEAMKAFIEFDKGTGLSEGLAAALRFVGDNMAALTNAAAAFLAVLAVQKIAAITVAVYELAAAGKVLDTILNGLGKGSWIAILISALVFLGTKIYDAMIKPLLNAGETGALVAKYISQSFINGFLNIVEAAISLFPAIGKIIADSLTPGKDMTESLQELKDIYKGILSQERVQFVSPEDAKRMQQILQGQRDLGNEAKKTGQYTKDVATQLSEEAQKALKNFTDLVFKMATANRAEQDRLLYGEKYAATQKVITEEVQKARAAGLTLSEGQKKDLANLVAQQFALKDIATTRQTLVGLADQITVLNERDVREQEVLNGLLQYERSVSAETYELNKGTVNLYLRKIQTLKDMAAYNQAMYEIDQQRALLNIEDRNEREIATRLQQYQGQVSKDMFEATKSRVAEELKINQQLEYQRSIQDEINTLTTESLNSTIQIGKFRRVEDELTRRFVESGKIMSGDQLVKLRGLLQEKQLREEIGQLMESEKYFATGTYSEMVKIKENAEVVYWAIDKTNKKLDEMRATAKQFGIENEKFVGYEEQVQVLEKLSKLQQKYAEDLQIQIHKIRGENAAALMIQQDQEMKQLIELNNQKLIMEEDLYKGISEIRKKYMYEIQQAAIQEALVTQGIRANIFGREVQLMSVNKDTAEQIARDRVAFEKKTEYDKTQFFLQQSATVFDALGKQNKDAFKAAQALNIAVALMNTYRAASVALATYPWPFSLVAVAAAVATGMAQVAAIRSQSYSGRALGGGVMGGASYIVGERGPELFTPTNSGKITRNQDLGTASGTTVNFTVVANDTRGFDELLTARRGLITQIIQDAQLEKGRRI